MRIPTLLAVVSLVLPVTAQSTWYVDTNGTPPGTGTVVDPYASIQYAFDQAATLAGDTLVVSPGLYTENVLDTKGVKIQGAGPDLCTIIAPNDYSAVRFQQPGAEFSGFTVTPGLRDGVHVEIGATLGMYDCIISHNASHGVNHKGTLWANLHWFNGCTIADNGGQGLRMIAPAAISDTIVWGNELDNTLINEGGHHNCCQSYFSDCDIEGFLLNDPYGAPYPNVLDTEPFFRDPANGDYRLLPGSPCIGTSVGGTDMGAVAFDPSELGGVSYCTAGTSASGCQAQMGALGTASATADSGFLLTVVNVESQKDGLFFYGTNGRQANAWGNGTSFVCVVPPRVRGPLSSGFCLLGTCGGSFTLDLNARWCATCPKPAHNPGAGAVGQAQLWYRDPTNTSNQTSSMSDAVEFVVEP